MNNIIDLDRTKKTRRLKQANVLKEILTILKSLFAEDKKGKIIAQIRKKTLNRLSISLAEELVKRPQLRGLFINL